MTYYDVTFLAWNYMQYLVPLVLGILACRLLLWHRNRKACARYMPQSRRIFERVSHPLQWMLTALCDAVFVALCVLALAHPVRTVVAAEPVLEQTATIVAIDVSRSMSSEEGYFGDEGRLGAVKRAFRELLTAPEPSLEQKGFLNRLQNLWTQPRESQKAFLIQGHRVGLVTFAGEAFGQMPPIDKNGILLSAFRQISTKYVPMQGTNFEAALRESLSFFSEKDTVRTVILLSDGEKEESIEPSHETFRELAEKHVRVLPIVVGHERALIPGTDIETEPSEEIPNDIATRTGGALFRFSEREKLYGKLSEIFADVRKESERPVASQENLQPWCALAALIVLGIRSAIQYFLPGTRAGHA